MKQLPDIGTPEFHARNRGNLAWRGDDRTVNKPLEKKAATRAQFLRLHRIISEAEKDLAERIMDLYALSGCTIRALDLAANPGSTVPLTKEVTKKDEFRACIRKLGSYWGTVRFEFLEEMEPGVEHYRTSIPHPIQIDSIQRSLDKADTFFYEWQRNLQYMLDVTTKK